MLVEDVTDDDILFWQQHSVTKLFLQLLAYQKEVIIEDIMRNAYDGIDLENRSKGAVNCINDLVLTVDNLRDELLWAKLIDRKVSAEERVV